MIVIPPRDPNENNGADPGAEALGKLYEQFTNVQNLAEFHAALRKRDALYEAQHGEMNDGPQDYGNLHPKDFFDQFHRRADEDDKAVVAEAPYRVRQQLRDVLAPERDTALDRARETYKKLFIDRQLAQLEQDRLYYLGKIADATNDQDRERYATALIGRLKLSGDVGLLYKDDAERLIENIPSDLDIFTFNRESAADPARAQRLLLYGAYPNIRPELRDELVKEANSAAPQLLPQAIEPAPGDISQATVTVESGDSESNNDLPQASNDQGAAETEPQWENTTEGDDADSALSGEQYAAAGPRGAGKPGTGKQPTRPTVPIQKFTQPIIDWRGRKISADDLNRATAVLYGEMTGSDDINKKRPFNRIDKATGSNLDTTMTKLGQVGEAYGLASILWNRLEKPGEYSSPGQPKPKDLSGIITSKGQFISVGKDRYNQVMNGRVDDPQAYELAREAVERTARFGPSFNFDSNRAALENPSSTQGRELRAGWVNMGSGTDFGRIIKP
ncbi:MAG TPA: hypothetical protein VL754_21490 [Verrucomicrobiae bacterium]|nr:hypothetical protein [Verrucomicrobiae bacterium]